MIERQELHCHNCLNYVQFDLDTELNGNHILTCPICGHEHCRVVKDGKITDGRWDSRNGNSPIATYTVSNVTWSTSSTWYATGANVNITASTTGYVGNYYMYSSWLNTAAI